MEELQISLAVLQVHVGIHSLLFADYLMVILTHQAFSTIARCHVFIYRKSCPAGSEEQPKQKKGTLTGPEQ